MTNEYGKVDLLLALGWDLRSLGEAQVRSITAMQRCIEDYRKASDPEALREIRRHIHELEHRSVKAKQSFTELLAAVDDIEANLAGAG
jgi:hypothetical protein